jgi:shikimate kinase
MSSPVYLIGARGCGKTTIGRLLAEQMNYRFQDTDHYLQQQCQCSIADFVAGQGWDAFRRREQQALQALTSPASVIATGGGVVLNAENRQFMQQQGIVVWLHVPAAILAQRLLLEPETDQRPMLTNRPLLDETIEVLQQRLPLYQAAAQHQINAADDPEKIVQQLLRLLNNTPQVSGFG